MILAALPMLGGVLKFLGSPAGKYVAIGLAVLAAWGYVDRRATMRERARCDAAALRSQIAAKDLDLASARRAAEEDRRAIEELAGKATTAEAQNEELRQRIAKLPVADQCIVTDEHIKRLRPKSRP